MPVLWKPQAAANPSKRIGIDKPELFSQESGVNTDPRTDIAMSLHQPDFTRAQPIAPANPLPLHSARALTQGGQQAQIELDGKVYDLRITRAGKLILTK